MDVQRQIRFEPHRPAVSRVVEPERHGMQGLTLETNKSVTDLFRRSALFGIPAVFPVFPRLPAPPLLRVP